MIENRWTRACCLLPLVVAFLVTAPAASAQSRAAPPPLFELDRGSAEIVWERGDDAGLTASVTLHRPTARLVRRTERKKPGARRPPEGPGETVRDVSPIRVRVDRIAVHDATLLLVDLTAPDRVLLRIHDLEALVENFSTAAAGSGGLPAMVTAKGRIGSRGHLNLFTTLNPYSEDLDFAGRAGVVDLGLPLLSPLFAEQIDLRTVGGSLSLYAEFSVNEGRIEGAVKPILSGVDVAAAGRGIADQIKSTVGQGIVDLFSDDVARRHAVASVVPLRGRLVDPDVDVWSAIVAVVENAFIEAIGVGFRNLSPPQGNQE